MTVRSEPDTEMHGVQSSLAIAPLEIAMHRIQTHQNIHLSPAPSKSLALGMIVCHQSVRSPNTTNSVPQIYALFSNGNAVIRRTSPPSPAEPFAHTLSRYAFDAATLLLTVLHRLTFDRIIIVFG